MHGHITVCSTILLLKDISAVSNLRLLQINFIETFIKKLYINISLHLSGLNAKDCNCWKTEYLVFYEMCILFCGIAMYDRSIFLYHYQHLVLLLFFILAILICCRLCYCGLIWIFLMANNMELFINFFSLHTLLN